MFRRIAALVCVAAGLIVADANHDAIRLYESFGFHEVSRHVMEKDDWDGEGDWWIAMRRDV